MFELKYTYINTFGSVWVFGDKKEVNLTPNIKVRNITYLNCKMTLKF